MELDQLYIRARKYHGSLNRDAVHDLYVKFGEHLPSDAYLTTCIKHARIAPAQEMVEVQHIETDMDYQEENVDTSRLLNRAIENVRNRYELEVDTFLECCVNSNYTAFSAYSGISITVLKKICTFAKNEIKNEFIKIQS